MWSATRHSGWFNFSISAINKKNAECSCRPDKASLESMRVLLSITGTDKEMNHDQVGIGWKRVCLGNGDR